jgi:hypothetical protein
MDSQIMFLDCPAYLDAERKTRCGLPAEVEYRYTMRSTDGPLESARIRCPRDHRFNGPVEFLTWRKPVRVPRLRSGREGPR